MIQGNTLNVGLSRRSTRRLRGRRCRREHRDSTACTAMLVRARRRARVKRSGRDGYMPVRLRWKPELFCCLCFVSSERVFGRTNCWKKNVCSCPRRAAPVRLPRRSVGGRRTVRARGPEPHVPHPNDFPVCCGGWLWLAVVNTSLTPRVTAHTPQSSHLRCLRVSCMAAPPRRRARTARRRTCRRSSSRRRVARTARAPRTPPFSSRAALNFGAPPSTWSTLSML